MDTRLERALYIVLDRLGDDWKSGNDTQAAYASEAGGCARKIGFRMMQMERVGESTASISVASGINFALGNVVHEWVQDAFEVLHGEAFDREIRWDLNTVRGRVDGLYEDGEGRVAVEIKTTSPMSFKKVIQNGPYPEHVLQASMGAVALEANRIHMVYVNKSPHGERAVIDTLLPVDEAATWAEVARLGYVSTSYGVVVHPRETMTGIIEEPKPGMWPCSWCSYFTPCRAVGPGMVPITDELREVLP